MGTIISYKHGEGSVKGVDPRLWDIVQHAVAASPYNAIIRSGAEHRSSHSTNHNPGWAVDVTLVDPKTGKAIPDYQNGPSFAIYEQYAQTARIYQQQKYPKLNDTFRWGGYFSSKTGLKGYGAVDLMHLDINPNKKGAMAVGSWANGASKTLLAAYPGAATNGGLAGPNGSRLVAQYNQQLAGNGGLVPPAVMTADAPKPANLTRGLDQKRMEYAAQVAPPFPLSMPASVQQARQHVASLDPAATASPDASLASQHAFDSPRTPQQLGDIYSGILPPNGSDPTGPGASLADLLSFNPARTHVASIDPQTEMPRLPAPTGATPNLNIPDGSNLPRADVSYSSGLGAFMTPEAREEAITRMASLGQTSVQPIGTDILELAMRDARMPQPMPRLPAPVRVPTGPNADPVGNGATSADLARFVQPARETRDPVGSGATMADLYRFNPSGSSSQTTVSRDPIGSGVSYADLIRFNPPSRPPQSTTTVGSSGRYDPVGSGASFADLGSFNRTATPAAPPASSSSTVGSSGRYDPVGNGASYAALRDFVSPVKTSGVAGTVVLPHNVTPQVPQIAPPQTTTKTVTSTVMVPNPAYIPPKGSVVTPTGGTITQSQMDAIRAVPANSYMKPITPAPVVPQFIPKQVTKTIQVPLPVAPVPAPVSQKLMARANAMPPPLTLQGMLQNWWAGTPLGSGINAIMGNKPPAQTGGGLLGAAFNMLPRQQTALNIAAQAQHDPLGYAIGQANRASPSPTYDVSGGNNAFNPISVQNSSRWQTGY